MNIKQTLIAATNRLNPISDSARHDAEVLLCFVLKKTRSFLFTWPEQELDSAQTQQFNQLLQQRQEGQPIAYLTGEREFWSLPFIVNKAVLIPRHDTEILVEKTLELIQNKPSAAILELGTGSGCIACAISSERPDTVIDATDISQDALAVCQRNISQLVLTNIQTHHGSWFDAIKTGRKFDLIVSNPPYIREQDEHLSQGDLPAEPETALHSGVDGLNAIRHIIKTAPQFLHNNSWLVLEHGYDQAEQIQQLFNQQHYQDVFTTNDLSNTPRITGARFGQAH